MPRNSIKVVPISTETVTNDEPVTEPEAPQQQVEEPQEQEEYQEEEEEPMEPDVDSEDLEELVKEYTKQRKRKQKESDPRVGCQHCGKQMSAKSLKYSHQRNCKSDPANLPPPPPPPAPVPHEPAKMKTRAPRKQTKPQEVEYEIIPPSRQEEAPQPLTTSYVKLMETKRNQKQARIKSLASQAF